MFGKLIEVLINNPLVLIFRNEDISMYYHFLLFDRWHAYEIRNNQLFAVCKTATQKTHFT